jgi:beta-glucosidase
MDRRWLDPGLDIDSRVELLLAEMTNDEKIAQLSATWAPDLLAGGRGDPDAMAALIPHGTGEVTRIGGATNLLPAESAALLNVIQRVAVERTRLGIPVIVHEESLAGYCARGATVFPQAIGLASTWDPDLVGEIADVIREQLLAVGGRHALAPVLDVARDPRWGRLEETYGEDPVLNGTLGVAYVRGLQGPDLREGVACTAKHFAGHGLHEGGMNQAPVQLGPRELREVFAEPFAAVIRDAGIASVMPAYNSVDGLPCSGSAQLMDDLLRGELGFDGVACSDYFAIEYLRQHQRVAADNAEAAVVALTAGMDLELPAAACFGEPLRGAVEEGRVDVTLIDRSVRRVLALKFRLGLFERPYVDAEAAPAAFETPGQRALARRAAARSIVVLKNNGVLPLPAGVRTIAVIGPGTDDPRLLQGDYHYPAHQGVAPGDERGTARIDGPDLAPVPAALRPTAESTKHVTPLAALREALPAPTSILVARGCDVRGDDRSGFDEAVDAARRAEIAIVVAAGRSGLSPASTSGEARDVTDLRLPGVQEDLVRALAATGTPVVVIVLSGRAHVLTDVVDAAAALVQAWPLGEEGGNGLVDVLLGVVNPSGRLTVTLPRSTGQVPIYHAFRAGGGKSIFYHDYVDSPAAPLFPFGHGLSYTTFAYGELDVVAAGTRDPLTVAVSVTNSGAAAGTEVVQLYASDLVASVARPERLLVGFRRVDLAPGEEKLVTFTVHPSRLAFYDPSMRFVCEPGEFTFAIGASSADIRVAHTVRLSGPVAEFRQREVVATRATVEPLAGSRSRARDARWKRGPLGHA